MSIIIRAQDRLVKRVQRRYWCFTDFGTVDNDGLNSIRVDAVDTMYNDVILGIKYIVWQLERCPDTDRIHIQGYVELQRSQDVEWLKRNVSRSAHYEFRRGTSEEADAYCRKENTREDGPYSRGDRTVSRRGERVDLISFRDRIMEGATLRELNEEHPIALMRYSSYVMRVRNLYAKPYDRMARRVRVTLLIGPPGCGKTKMIYQIWRDKDFYRVPTSNGTLWWDGYDGQELVLLDDFAGRASKIGLTDVLQLLDSYPIMLQNKGGFVWSAIRRIMVTTNLDPRKWYDYTGREVHYQALRRRFYSIVEWKTVTSNPETPENDEFWNRYQNEPAYDVRPNYNNRNGHDW